MLFTSQVQGMQQGYYSTSQSKGDLVSNNGVEMREIRALMKNYSILGQSAPETKHRAFEDEIEEICRETLLVMY